MKPFLLSLAFIISTFPVSAVGHTKKKNTTPNSKTTEIVTGAAFVVSGASLITSGAAVTTMGADIGGPLMMTGGALMTLSGGLRLCTTAFQKEKD